MHVKMDGTLVEPRFPKVTREMGHLDLVLILVLSRPCFLPDGGFSHTDRSCEILHPSCLDSKLCHLTLDTIIRGVTGILTQPERT
jgi:hypothetical protein